MTFDMQKSRADADAIINIIPIVDDDQDMHRIVNAARDLSAALTEIERLDREVGVARNLASLAKGIVDEQAKRIAELKKDNKYLGDRWKGQSLTIMSLQLKNAKQRAALKKLGKRSGKRGKALVEERAKDGSKLPELCDIVHDELMCPALDGDCEHWEGCPRKDELRQNARQQLRREGLL